MTDSRKMWRELLLLSVCCTFFFFYGLGSFGLVGADEPRYAQVAREMLHRQDWVTPTLYGNVWLEKPIFYYWSTMASYWLFGVRDWAARLPSAIMAAGLVMGVYFFLRRFRRGAELACALATVSCAGVLSFARSASTDMVLAAPFTLALLAWWAWRAEQRKIWLLASYFLLALATLAKGPVAPFLAAIIILLYVAAERQWRLLPQSLWPAGIFTFFAVSIPWYALVQARNPQFFDEFILRQNLARFASNLYRHPQPVWYYIPVLILGLFPWTVFAFAGCADGLRHWKARRSTEDASETSLHLFLVVWAVAPIVFFSLSQSKLPGYILPALPAWAMLAGIYLQRRVEEAQPIGTGTTLLHTLYLAAVSGAVLLSIRLLLHPHAPIPSNVLRTAAIGALLVFLFAFFLIRTAGWDLVRLATLLPVILAVGFLLKIAAPTIEQTQSARPVALHLVTFGQDTPISTSQVHRATEYGLAFYRNQPVASYDGGDSTAGRHLLVAGPKTGWNAPPLRGRHRILVGDFPQQELTFWWLDAAQPPSSRP